MLACLTLLCTPSLLRAQVPQEIQFKPFDLKHLPAPHQSADMPCNDAGTFTFGQFIGSSNDVAPSPIFLCFGDSLLVQHNGNADLSGSPNPATPAGVAYAFYTCPPTVHGPTLQDIGQIPGPGDPCVLSGSANGLFITQAVANGEDTWFFNSGALQTAFNMGLPLSLWFAPITVDNFANNTYEPGQPGFPPGPCVNVNTAAAFEVIYLNAISATGINTNFSGNDCLGRFSIRGGFPQYDLLYGSGTAVFTISISLASDPSVKAVIHTGADQLFHQASVVFSVPQAGVYNIVVEDGKSCPFTFQMDMDICDPSDNLVMSFPHDVVPPGGVICVPVTVQNFNLVSGNFSIEWDETVLAYNSVTNLHPILDPFNATTLNTATSASGQIGFILFDDMAGGILNIPDGEVLFEVCFNAIGQLGDCSGLNVTNSPTGVALEDANGQPLALSVDTGQVCIAFLPLSFTTLVSDTSCLGLANLNVIPAGGVEPYDVIVTQLPTGPNYNGSVLTPGGVFTVTDAGSANNTPVSYNICVIDNNGAGATVCTTIVINIPRLGAQINFAQQPLCNGQSTGVINAVVLEGGITVPNPGPQYTFAWSPAGVPNPGQIVQNGVTAGLYTVTVTNTNTGCSEVASGTLGQPAPISRELATNTPASCTGVCDGTITYEAEGGTPFPGPTYQFSWTYVTGNTAAGTGFDNPYLLSNGCPGDYQVVVTDANGCTFTDNLSLPALRTLSIATNNITNVSCNGGNNGSATITVTESVVSGQTYSFFWLPTGFTQVDNSPSSMYSDLTAGDYIVLAVDALGCQTFDTVTITEPPLLTLDSLGQSNPGCAQPNSGSISAQAFGGTGFGTYTYVWSAPGGMGGQISGLPFGTYTVTVTDGNACTATRQFNLPMPMAPAATVDSIPVRCGGDGSLTVSSPTGEKFVWIDGTGAVIDSSATISNIDGGTYIYRVFDVFGCVATDTLQFGAITPMFFSDTTLTPPTCFGLSNGQIAVGVQGGNPPYTQYTWSPTQPNSPVIFTLVANTYDLTVTDNQGCTLTGSFTLTQPPAIANVFSSTVNSQVSCFGVCDASATPIVAYATVPPTPGDFNFLWSNGSTDSLQVNVLCAGPATVTITDANNCFTVETVDITTPPQITAASVSITDARCFGDSTGGASITAAGGNGAPYTFLWNTGAATPSITGVPAGNYTVTITDVNGCSNSINTVTIGQPAPLGLSTSTTELSCFGGNNGQATVEVLGGTGPFSFLWQNASGNNVGNAQMAEMLTAGTYVVFVTDANGCTSSTNATLQDPPPVVGDFEDLDPLTCFGDESILRILTIAGGSGGPYRFSVDFGAVLDPSFPVRIGGGKHYITYIDFKGCAVTDSFTLAEPPPITVIFDPSTVEVELGEYADLEPVITGASVFNTIVWTNPETLLDPDTINASAYTFTNLSYTLTVTDTFGCSGTGTVLVVVDPNRNVYIPNAFKPANASGLNTHFNVNTGLGVELVNFMRVYDRWGNMMYQRERFLPNNDNLSEGWDGRFNGQFVNPGVFVYIVEVKFLDGRVLLYRGDVTVVR